MIENEKLAQLETELVQIKAGLEQLEAVSKNLEARLTKIETMLEDFKGIEQKATEAYALSIDNKKRLDKIEDNNRWLFRTTVAAIIGSLIGVIVSFVK